MPPPQNRISPITKEIVESIILLLASMSRNGIAGMKRKKGIQKIIKNRPTLIFQFFFFISSMRVNVLYKVSCVA